jgi:hypothetical protein
VNLGHTDALAQALRALVLDREEQRKRDDEAREEQRKRDEEQRKRDEKQRKRDDEAREEQRKRDDKAREEQRKRDEELVRLLTPTGQSNPTPATVGKQQQASLLNAGRWVQLKIIDDSDAVLNEAQLNQAKLIQNESTLVQWFTPHIIMLVEAASKAIKSPLVLVNTERHAWVKDSHLGAPSKPDMLITHPAFFQYNQTDSDCTYSGNDANFLFGQCAHWDLRDSIEAIVEWKVDMGANDFSALGEGVDYARRIMHISTDDANLPLDRSRLNTRLMIADRKGFQLVLCMNGGASECVFGGWGDNGSKDAVIKFLGDCGQNRSWVSAIQGLSQQFAVTTVTPAENTCCFLGRGSSGRVFQVSSNDSPTTRLAMKVALGDVGCSQIHEEMAKFSEFKEVLEGAKPSVVVTLSASHFDSKRAYAGLLLHPVGTHLPPTRKAILSAIHGLQRLSTMGLGHGDARLPNVTWLGPNLGERAVWLDLRTLFRTASDAGEGAFIEDVTTFVGSFRIPVDMDSVVKKAKESFRGKTDWKEQSDGVLFPLWRKDPP